MVSRKDLIYETNKHIDNSQQFETIRSFTKNIFNGKINLNYADNYQSNSLKQNQEARKMVEKQVLMTA